VNGLEAVGEAIASLTAADRPTASDPRWNSYDSPRAVVMTFRENMGYVRFGREDAWPRARAALPAQVEGDDGSISLREAAMALDQVFDRVPLEATRLPGPDAANKRAFPRYEVFPRGVDHRRIWSSLSEAPEGVIVVERGDDGAWRFTPETMRGAETLLASVRSVVPRYEEVAALDRLRSVWKPTISQTSWSQWMWAAGWLVGGVLGGVGLYAGLRLLARLTRRRGRLTTLGEALRTCAAPAAVVVVTAAIVLALHLPRYSPALRETRRTLIELLLLAALIIVLYQLAGLLGVAVSGWARRRNRALSKTAAPILVAATRAVLLGLLLLAILQMLLGFNVGGLLAGVGVLALAVGLAAKESLRNWFGAATIFFAQPFVEGDWIVYKGQFGQVERVGLNATNIRAVSGELLTVPNMDFIDESIENATERKYLRREMDIAVPYDNDAAAVGRSLDVIKRVLADEDVQNQGQFQKVGREPHVTFSHFGPDHLNLRAYYWYYVPPGEAGWYDFLSHCDTVNRKLFDAFQEEQLSFAFPTQTLRLTDDPDRKLSLAATLYRSNGESPGSNGETAPEASARHASPPDRADRSSAPQPGRRRQPAAATEAEAGDA